MEFVHLSHYWGLAVTDHSCLKVEMLDLWGEFMVAEDLH